MAGKGVGNPTGVRLNPRHQAMVKQKIRAAMLINRLQGHVLGHICMSDSQIRAAAILLNKIVPDAARTLNIPELPGLFAPNWQALINNRTEAGETPEAGDDQALH